MMTVAHPPAPDDHPAAYFPAQSSSTTQAQQYQMENQRRLHGAESPGTPEADVHAPHPLSAKDVGLDPLAISPKGQAPISGAGLPSERRSPQLDEAQPVEQTTGMPGSFPEDQEYVLHSLVSCPLVTDPNSNLFPGPSSAPAVPSVISVTHPPHFIHTHHPRRGSLTPLGLNVISPVPPHQVQQSLEAASVSSSPMRNVGFLPQGYSMGCDPASPLSSRRDSVATVATTASASSNLTATRPQTSSNLSTSRRRSSLTPSISSLAPPGSAGFNPNARRPSLTPSVSTLAAPSPSRATAMGKSTRTDGQGSLRTADVLPHQRRSSLAGIIPSEGRRGSLPQLAYSGWGGPSRSGSRSSVNRGSIDTTAQIDEGYRFGSGPPMISRDDTALGSLQRIATLTSANKRTMTAFEAAEAQEAERQRRAFFAATYGEDSRRARARLSLGGPSTAGPSSPSSTRRTSLLVWKRVRNKSSDTIPSYDDLLVGARRPSLPVSIPPRSPTADDIRSYDDQSVWNDPDSIDLNAPPTRPLPPLLPLSDPVPRLLHSTLALHRANHLLSSRNVEPEPLPSPLPPSLHPPAPVDLSEFDIDFILAGSRSQLGDSVSSSSKRPSLGSSDNEHYSTKPPLEEEDSFAKFVGAFDDEYGDRRGDWTFRSVRSRQPPRTRHSDVFPIDEPPADQYVRPRAEWQSHKGGKFQMLPNGDVVSVESGTVWSVKRTNTREYEIQHGSPDAPVQRPDPGVVVPPNAPQPLVMSQYAGYTLTSKLVHAESGGVKLPLSVQKELKARSSRARRLTRAAARRRQSTGADGVLNGHDFTTEPERTSRLNSTDSTATAIPEPPLSPRSALQSSTSSSSRPPLAVTPSSNEDAKGKGRFLGKRTDSDDDKHKKSGLGGVFKRGLFKASNLLDERKERSNSSSHPKPALSISSSSYNGGKIQSQPMRQSPSDRSDAASASADSSFSNLGDTTDDGEMWGDDQMFGSLGLGIEDEQNGGLPWKEGKAWSGVPDEALAMVIPIEADKSEPPSKVRPRPNSQQLFINPFFVDGPKQVLLVWFTPFGQGDVANTNHHGSSQTLFKIPEQPHHESAEGPQTPLGRLPKLLRPRGSHRDSQHRGGLHDVKHIPLPPPTSPPAESSSGPFQSSQSMESHNLQPLPFKGFRVVAKVADAEDLRSEPEVPVIALEQWTEQVRTGKPVGAQTPPLEGAPRAANVESSRSPSLVEGGIKQGREFPTIIAFCHNQNNGVEFVLEGLDRLGLCKGESAWGPTGYEEWRGTGLSENGRRLLDLVWAGCSAVMGL